MERTLSKTGTLFISQGGEYIVNQMECKLGCNAYSRCTMYKVHCTSGPNPSVEIVSPIAQSLNRTKYVLEGKGGRTRCKSNGPIKRKSRSCSSSHKGSSQRRKKTSRKKAKERKRPRLIRERKRRRQEKGGGAKNLQHMSPSMLRKRKAKGRQYDGHTHRIHCHIWGDECQRS